jgi:hypothetical protein
MTLGFVFIATFLTYNTWQEMTTANNLARTHFIRDQGTYVWISEIGNPEIATGKRILWKINYGNFGKSPASGFLVGGQITFGKDIGAAFSFTSC